MYLKHHFTIMKRQVTLLFRVAPLKTKFHYGMGNRCSDGYFVPFLDYDETPLQWIYDEIKLLQRNTDCGSAYVFKTKHGHHVVFLEKFSLGELLDIMEHTSTDKNYRLVPLKYTKKVWVLRQSEKEREKIEYLGRVYDPSTRERSEAHAKYLNKYCGVPLRDLAQGGFMDGEQSITMGYYHVAEQNN